MNGEKLGTFALVLIITAAVIMPVVLTGSASAEYKCGCTWQNCLTVARLFDSPSDYRWMGDWDPRFDTDMQTHYCGINRNTCDYRCDLRNTCGMPQVR